MASKRFTTAVTCFGCSPTTCTLMSAMPGIDAGHADVHDRRGTAPRPPRTRRRGCRRGRCRAAPARRSRCRETASASPQHPRHPVPPPEPEPGRRHSDERRDARVRVPAQCTSRLPDARPSARPRTGTARVRAGPCRATDRRRRRSCAQRARAETRRRTTAPRAAARRTATPASDGMSPVVPALGVGEQEVDRERGNHQQQRKMRRHHVGDRRCRSARAWGWAGKSWRIHIIARTIAM